MDLEGYGSGFDQAQFLLSKQLVYFERYGKQFLPDSHCSTIRPCSARCSTRRRSCGVFLVPWLGPARKRGLTNEHIFMLAVLSATSFFDGFDSSIKGLALTQIRDTFR